MLFRSPSPAAPPAPSFAPPSAASQHPPGVILVVDDSAMIRTSVVRALQTRQHAVHQAENGRLGLELWEKHRDAIQLVISDVFMPELDGLSMSKEIRKRSRTVPILLMSSKLDDNSRWVAEEAGFRLLPKPFKDEVLLMLADRLLRSARPA